MVTESIFRALLLCHLASSQSREAVLLLLHTTAVDTLLRYVIEI